MLFKNRYVDFVVEEILPFDLSKEPSKESPRVYIQIEKQNRTTMSLVKQVMKTLKLSRKKIGIAWLKDKHALTRQYLCFHYQDITSYGEKKFLQDLQAIIKVVAIGFAPEPLNLSSPISNTFWIRLRKNPKHQEQKRWGTIKWDTLSKQDLEEKLSKLYSQWFMNLYGEQRFGFTHANHRIAQDIIEGKHKKLPISEKKFKLQALASFLFNEYCQYRYATHGLDTLEGDIMQDGVATWPVIGEDLTRAKRNTPAGALEKSREQHFEISKDMLFAFKKLGLYGRRRARRVKPTHTSHQRQWDDLLLQFTLPSGSYASVLIRELLGENTEQ